MDAPAGYCMFCGRRAIHAHHLTGRGPDHAQIHDTLTVYLCRDHHLLVHNELRAQRIDTPPPGPAWTTITKIAHVLRRLAVFIARFATFADNPMWIMFAVVLESCADELDQANPAAGLVGALS
jgi:hypothetical protein